MESQIFDSLHINQGTNTVSEYKVKLFDAFRNAKVTDPIFKRHVFQSGLNKDIRARLELLDNSDYNSTIRNAIRCEKSVMLDKKQSDNQVLAAVNILTTQFDRHAQTTEDALVKSESAIKILQNKDARDRVANVAKSPTNIPRNGFSREMA